MDLNTITNEAHSIKGSAANLKLDEISKLALIIEQASKNNLKCDYNLVLGKMEEKVKQIN
ncbi:MAG: hypothetical protein DSZ06_04680 [Sulfurospirillum sp.]|nr:MAG: hypothetical protein DSZ06_04680 [Sulfurospirillum sp.]